MFSSNGFEKYPIATSSSADSFICEFCSNLQQLLQLDVDDINFNSSVNLLKSLLISKLIRLIRFSDKTRSHIS